MEEIELSDGHNDAVESGHTRKSDRTIPMTNILENIEKANDPGKFLLDESAKLDKQNNNGEIQDNLCCKHINFYCFYSLKIVNMDKKKNSYEAQDLTEEQIERWKKRHPHIHAERRKLTPEEEEHWAKVRARIKEMREKGEI